MERLMDWLWENVTVSRMLLLFLFGVGIAYILETVVRLLIKEHPKTTNRHLDNRDEYSEQESFEQKATEVELIVSRENTEKQKNITQTQDKPQYKEDNTKGLFHAPDSNKEEDSASTRTHKNHNRI
jgi:hypothetical protein